MSMRVTSTCGSTIRFGFQGTAGAGGFMIFDVPAGADAQYLQVTSEILRQDADFHVRNGYASTINACVVACGHPLRPSPSASRRPRTSDGGADPGADVPTLSPTAARTTPIPVPTPSPTLSGVPTAAPIPLPTPSPTPTDGRAVPTAAPIPVRRPRRRGDPTAAPIPLPSPRRRPRRRLADGRAGRSDRRSRCRRLRRRRERTWVTWIAYWGYWHARWDTYSCDCSAAAVRRPAPTRRRTTIRGGDGRRQARRRYPTPSYAFPPSRSCRRPSPRGQVTRSARRERTAISTWGTSAITDMRVLSGLAATDTPTDMSGIIATYTEELQLRRRELRRGDRSTGTRRPTCAHVLRRPHSTSRSRASTRRA